MAPTMSFTREVRVYPGVFYLANITFVPGANPYDGTGFELNPKDLCWFFPNGILFVSNFQSHRTQVVVALDSDPVAHDREDIEPDEEREDVKVGAMILGENGICFGTTDEMFPDTAIQFPYRGPVDVRVQREVTESGRQHIPDVHNPNPGDLERWHVLLSPVRSP